MAETYVSTNSVGCATPSRLSASLTIQELCAGVNKDKFEHFGDRYLRFLEFYDTLKPIWKLRLWGRITSPCDYAFLQMKDYPTIAKSIGMSIQWHMADQALLKAQGDMNRLMMQGQMTEEEINSKLPPPRHIM